MGKRIRFKKRWLMPCRCLSALTASFMPLSNSPGVFLSPISFFFRSSFFTKLFFSSFICFSINFLSSAKSAFFFFSSVSWMASANLSLSSLNALIDSAKLFTRPETLGTPRSSSSVLPDVNRTSKRSYRSSSEKISISFLSAFFQGLRCVTSMNLGSSISFMTMARRSI